ncbi:MAG: hypothetical protein SGPRY_001553 [Prymnesium sp.]
MFLGMYSYILLSTLAGLVYPAYCSAKALRKANEDEFIQWLTYWVLYATLDTFEAVPDFLIGWLPLYYELKLFILVWLAVPTFDVNPGATQAYRKFLQPWLNENEGWLDNCVDRLKQLRADTVPAPRNDFFA